MENFCSELQTKLKYFKQKHSLTTKEQKKKSCLVFEEKRLYSNTKINIAHRFKILRDYTNIYI